MDGIDQTVRRLSFHLLTRAPTLRAPDPAAVQLYSPGPRIYPTDLSSQGNLLGSFTTHAQNGGYWSAPRRVSGRPVPAPRDRTDTQQRYH
jgi:hypothetical protein